LNFLSSASKTTHVLNLMKIRPVGAEFFNADGQTERQTDIAKLIVAFRNFAKTSKNSGNVPFFNYRILQDMKHTNIYYKYMYNAK
jgi:hypothetical protein